MGKILKFVFYRSENGKEPVKTWICSLNREEKKKVGEELRLIQKGWPLGMPLVKNIGGGLWEARISLENVIVRIIFAIEGSTIYALHAFVKKTNKLPKNDLKIAQERASKLKKALKKNK